MCVCVCVCAVRDKSTVTAPHTVWTATRHKSAWILKPTQTAAPTETLSGTDSHRPTAGRCAGKSSGTSVWVTILVTICTVASTPAVWCEQSGSYVTRTVSPALCTDGPCPSLTGHIQVLHPYKPNNRKEQEQSPYREADSSSAIHEIPHILWKSKVHYRIHKSSLLVPTPSQIKRNKAPTYFLKIYFNIILLPMPRSSKRGLLPSTLI